MTAAWPAELDPPMRAGFSRARGEGRLVTRPEAGPPRLRRRFSGIADPVALTLDLSRADLAVFDRFYETDTKHGSLPFTMPDPTTDGWPLLDQDGAPLTTEGDVPILLAETWLCLFGDRLPAASIAGLHFRVSMTILVLP